MRLKLSQVIRKNRTLMTLACMLVILRIASVVTSVDVGASLKTVLFEVIFYPVIFLAAVGYLRDRRSIENVLVLFIWMSLLICIFGLVEWLQSRNVFADLATQMGSADEYVIQAISAKIRVVYRVQAIFTNPLVLAHFLVVIIPLLFCLVMLRGRGRLLCAIAVVCALVNIWNTGSRAGLYIAAFLLAIFVVNVVKINLAAKGTNKRILGSLQILAIAVAFSVGIFFMSSSNESQQNEQEKSSSMARLEQLRLGLDSVYKYPFLGIGARQAAAVAGTSLTEDRVSVDNFYLTMVVENGIPALVLFCAFVFNVILSLLRARKLARAFHSWRLHRFYGGITCSLLAFASFFLINSLYEEIFPVFIVIVALGLVSLQELDAPATSYGLYESGKRSVA